MGGRGRRDGQAGSRGGGEGVRERQCGRVVRVSTLLSGVKQC